MTELLSDIAIQRELGSLAGWSRRGDVLTRTYQFRNFAQSMEFVNRVAGLAESANHHPDIDIRYSKVTLTLSTHDAGGITANDVGLARAIDQTEEHGPDSGDSLASVFAVGRADKKQAPVFRLRPEDWSLFFICR
jgi:4a-hydroxytetrahydrobiopterin dehydratase